jgi:hypothetical protein
MLGELYKNRVSPANDNEPIWKGVFTMMAGELSTAAAPAFTLPE